MRVVIDSGIVMDYLVDRKPFSDGARKLVILGMLKEVELWLPGNQLNGVLYTLTRGSKRSQIASIKRDFKILRKGVHICSVGEAEFDEVIESAWHDLEAACVHACALKLKADAIVTRHQRDFEQASVKVFDCDELFAYLRDEHGLTYEEIPW